MKKFTLIELLVVVAIIAILAAMILPNLQKSRQLTRIASSKSYLKQIGTNLATHKVDYPANLVHPIWSGKTDEFALQNVPAECPAGGGIYGYTGSVEEGVTKWTEISDTNSAVAGVSDYSAIEFLKFNFYLLGNHSVRQTDLDFDPSKAAGGGSEVTITNFTD